MKIKKRKKKKAIKKRPTEYNEFDVLKRDEKAVQLRIEGNTYPMIAKKLNCSVTTAWKAIQKQVKRFNEKYPESVERLRTIDLQRTDKLLREAQKMIDKRDPLIKAAGIDRAIKLMELRAKYIPKLHVPKQMQFGVDDELREKLQDADKTVKELLQRFVDEDNKEEEDE
jgi:hypothetical protein